MFPLQNSEQFVGETEKINHKNLFQQEKLKTPIQKSDGHMQTNTSLRHLAASCVHRSFAPGSATGEESLCQPRGELLPISLWPTALVLYDPRMGLQMRLGFTDTPKL